jgi:hypothetical protein
VPSGVPGHADLPHPVLFQHSRADHAGCVRVGPRGCAGSPATISTLALAPAARSVTRYSRSIASDRSQRAAMTGTGTNPDLFYCAPRPPAQPGPGCSRTQREPGCRVG